MRAGRLRVSRFLPEAFCSLPNRVWITGNPSLIPLGKGCRPLGKVGTSTAIVATI